MMSSIWKCQKGHSCKSQLASSQWGFLANFPCSQGEINANVPSMPPFSWKWLSSPFPSLPLRPPSEVLPPPAIHWFDTKALKLLYCGPLATCDWSRVWHMTQAGPIRALPWGFELGSRENVSPLWWRLWDMRLGIVGSLLSCHRREAHLLWEVDRGKDEEQ